MTFQEWLDSSKPTTVRFLWFMRIFWLSIGAVLALMVVATR